MEKRIGESSNMSERQKRTARYLAEGQKEYKRRSIINLEDEPEQPIYQWHELLPKVERLEAPRSDSDDDDEPGVNVYLNAINKTVGVVRVINRQTDNRTLIKGMEGTIQDISVACVGHETALKVLRGEFSGGGAGDEILNMNQRLENSVASMIHMNSIKQGLEEQANEIKQLRQLQEISQQNLLKEIDKQVTSSSEQQAMILEKIEAQSHHVSEESHKQSSQLQDVLENSVAMMIEELKKTVGNTEKQIKEYASRALTLQQVPAPVAAVRPRAVTPAPQQLQRTHIMQLIEQGQTEAAFTQVLSEEDPSLLVFLCEKVDPHQLFDRSRGIILQQRQLLYLVWMLALDLSCDVDIKLKYLTKAVVNLDSNYLQEDLPEILRWLQTRLNAYISAHPNARATIEVKILLLVCEALEGNFF